MLRHALYTLVAFGWLVHSGARADEPLPPMPDFAVADRLVPADPMPERRTEWTESDVELSDVVYATPPGYRPLHLDLYRPKSRPGVLPLVVFVHGGGWAYANPRAGAAFTNFPAVLAYLARRGYVVASIEHRFSGEAPFPAQFEDLSAAIRFLRSRASAYGIDGNRVALWGMSSGAHLAALGAVHCAEGARVQALAGWFGPYDLARAAHADPDVGTLVRRLLNCGAEACTPAVLEAASPVQYVDAGDPPTLLVQGAADPGMPEQAEEFAAKFRSAGVAVETLTIPAVRHGLVGANAAVTSQALRQGLTATFAFFDRVLKPAPGTAR